MEKKILRAKAGRFCQIEFSLSEDGSRFSVVGTEGRIITKAAAKKEALAYWASFFEESPEEILDMNKRFGKRFTSATGAAKYVLEQDGELHGLDIHHWANDDKEVYITESCGQIRESLAEWFPEYVGVMQHHLNDMHAECEHQQARGETYQTHPGAVCPNCGYKLGSKWLKRELPAEVGQLFADAAVL